MARAPAIDHRVLLAAARNLLTGLSRLGMTGHAQADDAFEYWLWAMNVAAGSTVHGPGSVTFIGLDQGRIRLRTSPSDVGTGQFTHAVLYGQQGAVEVHTGIYVAGVSGARHELDVVALEAGRPTTASGTRVDFHDVQWHMEAKLYRTDKALPLTIPRALLGSAYDLGLLGSYRVRTAPAAPFRQRFNRPWMALATSARVSRDGRRMLAARRGSGVDVAIASKITSTTRTQDLDDFLDPHMRRL